MKENKRVHAKIKARLHPNNPHNMRYDFADLTGKLPALKAFVKPNKFGDESIDFADAKAVKALNSAILLSQYNIKDWDIPEGYLTPPIPGRADYIHHAAELLEQSNFGRFPDGEKIKCFDVGVGASCIYPIIGNGALKWQFTASDIDPVSIEACENIIAKNPQLADAIELRLQKNKKQVLRGVMKPTEQYDLVICNPPFHSSKKEADAGTLRKLSNLKTEKVDKVSLNFGGQNEELWCPGGEVQFIKTMISEGREFGKSVYWFTSLVSKRNHEEAIINMMRTAKVKDYKIRDMGQGNKTSRIIAWTFLNREEQKEWKEARWKKA